MQSPTAGRVVVLGVTGSIAAYKAVYLTRLLVEAGLSVWPILTRSAERFVGALSFSSLAGRAAITDLWTAALAGEIGHVELAHRADLMVIAPCSADTLQRLAHGRADDPLGAVALAMRNPLLLAPAMESGMWEHPETQASLARLSARGARIVSPTTGALASGRDGLGRMAEPEVIFEVVCGALSPQDLTGRTLVVTAGPTREWFDPVRFISNPSSGKMGYALAHAARRRGARVRLISGPVSLLPPYGIELTRVETTQGLLDACRAQIDDADALIMAAAPADHRPSVRAAHKLKKNGAPESATLEPTPDVLRSLSDLAPRCLRIGFAAETERLVEHARAKLVSKRLDLVVANDITARDAGFGADTNTVTLVAASGEEALPSMSKDDAAARILDRVVTLLVERDGERA